MHFMTLTANLIFKFKRSLSIRYQNITVLDYLVINVSTELEMTSDARQNRRIARYVKHFKYAIPVILKRLILLIGSNDVVRYGVT